MSKMLEDWLYDGKYVSYKQEKIESSSDTRKKTLLKKEKMNHLIQHKNEETEWDYAIFVTVIEKWKYVLLFARTYE